MLLQIVIDFSITEGLQKDYIVPASPPSAPYNLEHPDLADFASVPQENRKFYIKCKKAKTEKGIFKTASPQV